MEPTLPKANLLMHISATLWHLIQFNEKLLANVQALETLGGIGEVNGYVRMTLDKLEGIRGDLVRTDDDWLNWKFPELIEALRKWTVRNPLKRDQGQIRDGQIDQKTSKQDSKSTSRDHVFIVMTLAKDPGRKTAVFQLYGRSTQGGRLSESNGMSTMQEETSHIDM
jgi:hypothetical protein